MVASKATEAANIGYLRCALKAEPDAPDAGFTYLYIGSDKLLYTKDENSLVTGPITMAAAIILAPGAADRNIIQPSADVLALTIEGHADATANLMELHSDGSTVLSSWSGAGWYKFGTGAATSPLHIVDAYTTDAAHISLNIDTSWTPSTPTGTAKGQNIAIEKLGAGNFSGSLIGLEIYADNGGSADITRVQALIVDASSSGSGTATTTYALYVTEAYTGGTITTAHGLYIEDQTNAANNYSIVTNAGFIVFNEEGHAESDFRIETDNEDHFLYIDSGANWLRVGDWDTNYTQWSVDGTQTMVGTARVKKILNLPVGGTGGGANKPTFTEEFAPFDGWLMSVSDDLHYEFEVPYDCDTTEDIVFAIHWLIDRAFADESAVVNWQIMYRAVTEDGTEPVDSGGSTDTVSSGDTNIPATAKAPLETTLTIAAADIDSDDLIGVDFSRIAKVGGVDPGGGKEPIVSQVHITYTSNKLGENIT